MTATNLKEINEQITSVLFVVRAIMSVKHDGMPRDAIFGYEPTVYADRADAEARAEILRATGDWPGERPEYYVVELGDSDLKPAEKREWESR
jgi:hypothetical protein